MMNTDAGEMIRRFVGGCGVVDGRPAGAARRRPRILLFLAIKVVAPHTTAPSPITMKLQE